LKFESLQKGFYPFPDYLPCKLNLMNACLFTKKQSEVIRLQTEVTELTEAPINAYNRYPTKV
jgi:hypothetical protein